MVKYEGVFGFGCFIEVDLKWSKFVDELILLRVFKSLI